MTLHPSSLQYGERHALVGLCFLGNLMFVLHCISSKLARKDTPETVNIPFFVRSISKWNDLTSHIVEVQTITIFKAKLKAHMNVF